MVGVGQKSVLLTLAFLAPYIWYMIPYGRYCNKAMSICIYSIRLQARLDAHEYSENFSSSKRLPLNLYKSLHLPVCDLVIDLCPIRAFPL
ncbi:hypothetical protein EYC80_004971 [Monilinia laxa]|uniref:Uncharacterized protein n=1 Tax=Monilinia laxa TaxID=61186 RepID=A0A5N6KIQ6_MONLA|nr:hypothetical protein EYC80_004971 [Monilinia laxa]